MAKKLDRTTSSIEFKESDICVPSNVLKDCEKIYSDFKKNFDKYAPGKLAFFKFNSTIVSNLKKLEAAIGNSLYKLALYYAYFDNCKGSDKIKKMSLKIHSNLDSLLESIKENSLSTLGISGLFSKDRSENEKLGEYYKNFENLKKGMESIVGDRKINLDKDILKKFSDDFNYVLYLRTDENIEDLSDNILKAENKEALADIAPINTNCFLDSTNVSKLGEKPIPLYAEAMAKFLTNSIKMYNNLYKKQHKFKKLYDLKNMPKDDEDDLGFMKNKYMSFSLKCKNYEKDLNASFECLEELTKDFKTYWSRKAQKSLNNITEFKSEIDKLSQKIKNSNFAFRAEVFENKNTKNDSSYASRLKSVSLMMEETFTNLSEAIKLATSPSNYSSITEKIKQLEANFGASNESIANLVNKSKPKNIDNTNKNLFEKAFRTYENQFEEIKEQYKELTSKVSTYEASIRYVAKSVEKQKSKRYLESIKFKAKVIASIIGASVSITGAIIKYIK